MRFSLQVALPCASALLLAVGCGPVTTPSGAPESARTDASPSSGSTAVPAPEAPRIAVIPSNWEVVDERSELDNTRSVFASVQSENMLSNSIGMGEKIRITIRCSEETTAIYIEWPGYMGFDGVRARWKIDDGPVQSRTLEPAQGGQGVGFWSGSTAIPMINAMLDHDRLVMSMASYGQGSQEAIFDIRGLRSAAMQVAEACSWELSPATTR